MELYRLRTFIAVAEEGHLTRAAKRLYTSQPAVSSHIKTLKEELGVTLFTRTPKGMELTRDGHKLQLQAKKALHAIDDLVFQAKSLQTIISGSVRLGLNINPVILRIGEFLNQMTKNHPALEFRMNQRMSWEVIEDLLQDNLDGGFILGPKKSEKIHTVPLKKLNLVIARAIQQIWAKTILPRPLPVPVLRPSAQRLRLPQRGPVALFSKMRNGTILVGLRILHE